MTATGPEKSLTFLSLAIMSVLAMVLLNLTLGAEETPASASPPPKSAPIPVSKIVPVVAVKLPPPPATAVAPVPRPPGPRMIAETLRENAVLEIRGRALLKMLEAGKGTSIEIAWPGDRAARDRLYQALKNCLGMKTVLLEAGERLFGAEGARGTVWRPNLDQFSTFVRRPTGGLSAKERQHISGIRARHGISGGVPIRLFPRRVDAVLLGGLNRLTAERLRDDVQITAIYNLGNSVVSVGKIRVNGENIAGRIVLPHTRRCG